MPRPMSTKTTAIDPGGYAFAAHILARACLRDFAVLYTGNPDLLEAWTSIYKTLEEMVDPEEPDNVSDLRAVAELLIGEADALEDLLGLSDDDADDLPADPEAGTHMPECDCDECMGLDVGLSDDDAEDLLDESDGDECPDCGRTLGHAFDCDFYDSPEER